MWLREWMSWSPLWHSVALIQQPLSQALGAAVWSISPSQRDCTALAAETSTSVPRGSTLLCTKAEIYRGHPGLSVELILQVPLNLTWINKHVQAYAVWLTSYFTAGPGLLPGLITPPFTSLCSIYFYKLNNFCYPLTVFTLFSFFFSNYNHCHPTPAVRPGTSEQAASLADGFVCCGVTFNPQCSVVYEKYNIIIDRCGGGQVTFVSKLNYRLSLFQWDGEWGLLLSMRELSSALVHNTHTYTFTFTF